MTTPDISPVQDAPVERATATVEQLEQEGDIAADFLEELMDIADIDGDLALDVKSGRAYVSLESEEPGSLALLSDPDTVQALQELTRIAVQNRTGRFSRLILDIGGSRDTRQRELETLVDRAIARLDGGRHAGLAPPDVELRAQARARHRRRQGLHLGVVRRGRRPSHRHQPRLMFHVKRCASASRR